MPDFGPDVILNDPAYIHPNALMFGRVTVMPGASIWPHVVIRAESYEVVVGEQSNLQDFVMIHVGYNQGTYIGSHCSITHHCTLHGCTIGDNCLVGINSTIMDGAVIGENTIIGAHSLVREGQEIPANSIVAGAPAKVIRDADNYVRNRLNAFLYLRNAQAYAAGNHRVWDQADYQAEQAAEEARLIAERASMT